MKKLLCLAAFAALAGCQSQPMSDEQRAMTLQYLQNQQRINQQTIQQNSQTQMQMMRRPVQTTCNRIGDQIYCNSN